MEDLATALSRYAHLIGASFNLDWVRTVEAAQKKVIDAIANDVERYDNLEELIKDLIERGKLYELAAALAEDIGDDVKDGREAVEAALAGNREAPGFRAGFLTIQAVARAFAARAEPIESQGGTCPICGTRSETAWKREGNYYMVCHLCGYTWLQSRERPSCPYCGNRVEVSIFIVTDKQRRVSLFKCEECKSVWRAVIDETIRAPPILIPLIAMAAEKYRPVIEQMEKDMSRYTSGG